MSEVWTDFLLKLKRSVYIFENRLYNAKKDSNLDLFPVKFDPTRIKTNKNEISIGVGAWLITKNDKMESVLHQGICLNNKMGAQSAFALGKEILSVTDLVVLANDSIRAEWIAALGDSNLTEIFETFTFIVEDSSPDSCFSLISFLATTVCGLNVEEIPKDWVNYVRRWEGGDVRTTGEPFSSWGALHSALAHARFEKNTLQGEDDNKLRTYSSLSRSWIDCLLFDIEALISGARPHDLSRTPIYPELLKAKAFLNFEYQQYLQSLQHSTTLQLLLPMDESGDRCKLIDAIIQTEHLPLGSQKCFIRNDTEHTWLRAGFSLMAINKPSEAGTGNDMVISLDPATGVHLKGLWERLELLEDEKWDGQRPCDQPRQGIVGYPEGKRVDGKNSPNQPWYDEQGLFTLIAAPKDINFNEQKIRGSQLKWEDVKDALWELYNPLEKFRFCSSNLPACKLHECADIRKEKDAADKQFIVARWMKEVANKQSFLLSPTVKRYFAACIEHDPVDQKPIGIDDLPDESTFDFLTVRGGFVIISEKGAILFDDWRQESPDEDGLIFEFQNVLKKYKKIKEIQIELSGIVKILNEQLKGKNGQKISDMKLLQNLTLLKLDMRKELTESLPNSSSNELKRFRESVEQRMGIGKKLEDFYDAVAHLEQTLRDTSEIRTNWIISNLTIYGFPLIFFAGFFQFLLQGIPKKTDMYGWTIGFDFFGIHWVGVGIYLLLTIFSMCALRYFVHKGKTKKSTKGS